MASTNSRASLTALLERTRIGLGPPSPFWDNSARNYLEDAQTVHDETAHSNDPDGNHITSTSSDRDGTALEITLAGAGNGTRASSQYHETKPIPRSKPKAFIFTEAHGKISLRHKERFPAVQETLQGNVEECRDLAKYKLSYHLDICGETIETAVPSIVVFAPRKLRRRLRSLFEQDHLKEQYASEDATRPSFSIFIYPLAWELMTHIDSLFASLGIDTAQLTCEQDSVSISSNAILTQKGHRTGIQRTQDSAIMDRLEHVDFNFVDQFITIPESIPESIPSTSHQHPPEPTYGPRKETLCGSIVNHLTSSKRTQSTASCIIDTGIGSFILTTAHAFDDVHEDFTDDDCSTDDSESSQESQSENELRATTKKMGKRQIPIAEESGFPPQKRTVDSSQYRIHRPAHNIEWQSHNADLDWALLELPDPGSWLPNRTITSHAPFLPVGLSEIEPGFPTEDKDVWVLTGMSGTLRGSLRTDQIFLSGKAGSPRREARRIALENGQRIQKGDSGSLVIDAKTSTIYGYVVGVNPLDHLYMFSMAHALDQVNAHFGLTGDLTCDLSAHAISPEVDWTVAMTLVLSASQRKPFPAGTTAYERCKSLGMVQRIVQVQGDSSAAFHRAVDTTFGGILQHRGWVPLKVSCFDGQSLLLECPDIHESRHRDWAYQILAKGFLVNSHDMVGCETPRSIFIAPLDDSFSWELLRSMSSSCAPAWDHDPELDLHPIPPSNAPEAERRWQEISLLYFGQDFDSDAYEGIETWAEYI